MNSIWSKTYDSKQQKFAELVLFSMGGRSFSTAMSKVWQKDVPEKHSHSREEDLILLSKVEKSKSNYLDWNIAEVDDHKHWPNTVVCLDCKTLLSTYTRSAGHKQSFTFWIPASGWFFQFYSLPIILWEHSILLLNKIIQRTSVRQTQGYRKAKNYQPSQSLSWSKNILVNTFFMPVDVIFRWRNPYQ